MSDDRHATTKALLLILASPFIVAAGLIMVLGLAYIVHITVARGVPTLELFMFILFPLACGSFGVFRSRRGMRGRLRHWEVEELRRRRRY